MAKGKKQNLKYNRNIRVIAENNNGRLPGFNVYLDLSGQREYIFTHRRNGQLYNLLKNGIPISQLKRLTPKQIGVKTGSTSTYDKVRHLLCVVEDYIDERSYLAEVS